MTIGDNVLRRTRCLDSRAEAATPERMPWPCNKRLPGPGCSAADEAGRRAHFAGQITGLLNEQAPEIVVGRGEDGVVANVHNVDILAIK